MIGIPSPVPILTISSTIATWDWTLELIVSLTDYDRIGGRGRAYVIITVSYKLVAAWDDKPLSFSVIGWTVVAMALKDMRWRI